MQPTAIPTLREISLAHQGKVSDKWSSYLDEYQRLFRELKDQPVSLLEIGVQNGGSLEIWAKYFENSRYLTGCDINENCRKLTFEDPRIAVFVGDANSDAIQDAIVRRNADFDIIIDDGSHRSGDIVKSFARYFPLLNRGGIFLAEDLHCSYWRDFEGGLFDPLSSIAFFKDLSDIVNHEHWGIPEARKALLEPYALAYGVTFSEQDLDGIQSVEFLNSICVVKKKKAGNGGLGIRCLSGTSAEVFSPERPVNEAGAVHQAPEQSGNSWSRSALFKERASAADTAKEISDLNTEIGKLIAERDARHAQLAAAMFEAGQANRLIEKLNHTLSLRENSISWRITAPLRAIMNTILRK
jgi:hypothetical protein